MTDIVDIEAFYKRVTLGRNLLDDVVEDGRETLAFSWLLWYAPCLLQAFLFYTQSEQALKTSSFRTIAGFLLLIGFLS